MGQGGAGRRLERLVVAVPLEERHLARLRERFPDLRLDVVKRVRPEDLAEADGLVGWQLDAEGVAAAPRLGWFQNGGAGVEGLPLRELASRGVIVTNASGVHAINIGEHVLAMMLAFARGLPALVRAQEARRWRDDDDVARARRFELHGQTLLLVGLGDIGLAVAERARAFGMRVLGTRRRSDLATPPGVDEVVPMEQLTDGLGRADHVVVSVPLTGATAGLIGAAELAAMKRGAYLYNVGRGGTVDTPALVEALAAGHLGGAGLDVTDPEPLPEDSPLWGMANVLITSHTSGGTPKYWDRGIELIEENIRRYRAGEPLLNEVDAGEGY